MSDRRAVIASYPWRLSGLLGSVSCRHGVREPSQPALLGSRSRQVVADREPQDHPTDSTTACSLMSTWRSTVTSHRGRCRHKRAAKRCSPPVCGAALLFSCRDFIASERGRGSGLPANAGADAPPGFLRRGQTINAAVEADPSPCQGAYSTRTNFQVLI